MTLNREKLLEQKQAEIESRMREYFDGDYMDSQCMRAAFSELWDDAVGHAVAAMLPATPDQLAAIRAGLEAAANVCECKACAADVLAIDPATVKVEPTK